MIVTFWLVTDDHGSIRTRKTKPDLASCEVAMKIKLELPDMLFKKPTFSATLSVSDKDVPSKEIEPQVVDNIKDAILEHAGLDMTITVVPPEGEKK